MSKFETESTITKLVTAAFIIYMCISSPVIKDGSDEGQSSRQKEVYSQRLLKAVQGLFDDKRSYFSIKKAAGDRKKWQNSEN